MKFITLLLMCCFCAAVNAQTQSQSIMLKDKDDGKYDHLTTLPEGKNSSQGDACMEMSRQIEQLKGKPQRRYALMERYRVECQRQ